MPPETENRIIRNSNNWNLSTILTIIGMCLGGIGYMNNLRDSIIAEIHQSDIEVNTVKGRVNNIEFRVGQLEQSRDKMETYFDKPKPIKVPRTN